MSNQYNEESQENDSGRDLANAVENAADTAIRINDFVSDLKNAPSANKNRMGGGNKSKQNNKGGEKQGSKGLLDKAKRLLKIKRARARRRRIRIIRKIIKYVALILSVIVMSVGMFLLSNPVTATMLVALGIAEKAGILGYAVQAWDWCVDTLSQVTDWVEDGWNCITDWIWPTDNHDDGTGNAEVQYDMGEIDNNDQYREALLKNYDLCKVIAEEAFSLAKDDADDYADAHGYDKYTIVNDKGQSLKRAKWTTLYTTEESKEGAADGINWGDLIIAMDICYSAENKTSGVNENNQYEDVDYNPNILEEYMEEGKDDKNADCNLRHLYHINSVEVEPDVYNVIITPFDITDLYEIGGLKPNDMFDTNTTYYDMMYTRQRQLKNVLASEEVYKTLGLYNETPLKENRKDVLMGDLATGNVSIDSISNEGTNKEKIWQALIDDGFTEIGAAAFMGNLQAENGFKTDWKGDQGSVGLCQWRNTRKDELVDIATTLGKNPTDIDVQIYYLLNYDFPKHNGGHYDDIKNATDITVATDRVCAEFEKPANYKNYEAWYAGKYSTDTSTPNHALNNDGTPLIINWKWFKYSETYDKYYIHLDRRRTYAEKIYAQFHSTN